MKNRLPIVSLKLDDEPSSLVPNQDDGITSKFLMLLMEKASLSRVSKNISNMQQIISRICLANFLMFSSLPITSKSLFFKKEINLLLIQRLAINQNNKVIPSKLRNRNHSKFNSCIYCFIGLW